MAKKSSTKRRATKRSKSRRRTARRGRSGLGKLALPKQAFPAFIGAAAAFGGVFAMRKAFAQPAAGSMQALAYKYSPLLTGLLGVAALPMILKAAGRSSDATPAAASVLGTGVAIQLSDWVLSSDPVGQYATLAPEATQGAASNAVAGLLGRPRQRRGVNAIVPQYGALPGTRGTKGLDAVMLEQLKGNEQGQGAVVDLKGMNGVVQNQAFGTSPFGG